MLPHYRDISKSLISFCTQKEASPSACEFHLDSPEHTFENIFLKANEINLHNHFSSLDFTQGNSSVAFGFSVCPD